MEFQPGQSHSGRRNRQEIVGLETGAADERAIDVGMGDVLVFYAEGELGQYRSAGCVRMAPSAIDVLWVTDKRGKDVGIPAAKLAYVELGSAEGDRRIFSDPEVIAEIKKLQVARTL